MESLEVALPFYREHQLSILDRLSTQTSECLNTKLSISGEEHFAFARSEIERVLGMIPPHCDARREEAAIMGTGEPFVCSTRIRYTDIQYNRACESAGRPAAKRQVPERHEFVISSLHKKRIFDAEKHKLAEHIVHARLLTHFNCLSLCLPYWHETNPDVTGGTPQTLDFRGTPQTLLEVLRQYRDIAKSREPVSSWADRFSDHLATPEDAAWAGQSMMHLAEAVTALKIGAVINHENKGVLHPMDDARWSKHRAFAEDFLEAKLVS